MLEYLKRWYYTRKMLNVQEFAHKHRDFLVIVCDPRDDTMFMSYRDKQISAKIRSMDGIDHRVVKNILRHSTFEREIDRLIGAVTDAFTVKGERCKECRQLVNPAQVSSFNTFIHFLDGALFRITKVLKFSKD